MRKIFIVTFLFFVAIANGAEKPHWPEGSAMHTGLNQKLTFDKKQEKMIEVSKKIQSKLKRHKSHNGEYLSELFQQHHDNWISYVDSTCMIVGVSTGSGGSWPSYYALVCKTNMTDQRLFKLTNTLKCINRHVKNKQNYEIPACLYQGYTVEY